jgi:hypothetical protein
MGVHSTVAGQVLDVDYGNGFPHPGTSWQHDAPIQMAHVYSMTHGR